MFSLFLAFSTSDIYQRSRDLNLAVQKEVSLARSIFKFSEAVGESANPMRDSLIEYLQAVTTLEEGWLEKPWSQRFVVAAFTAAAAAMCCLAWIDGLIGPSTVNPAPRPLSDLAQTISQ